MTFNPSAALLLAFCASAALAQTQSFRVGEKVELEASGRWVPCVVAEPGTANSPMRVDCEAYPALSRAGGRYIAHDTSPAGIRRPGAGAARAGAAPKAAAGPPLAVTGGLKVGEYACYGSGGRPMIGLAFKVQPGGRYTDLDGKSRGTFVVTGRQVAFRGGHLSGQVGRDLNGPNFRIGAQASCEPW